MKAINSFFEKIEGLKKYAIVRFVIFLITVSWAFLSIYFAIVAGNWNARNMERREVSLMVDQLVKFEAEAVEKNISQYENYYADPYRIITDCVSLELYKEVLGDTKVRNNMDITAYAYAYHLIDMAEYAQGYLNYVEATDEGKIQAIKSRDHFVKETNAILSEAIKTMNGEMSSEELEKRIKEIIDEYAKQNAYFYAY